MADSASPSASPSKSPSASPTLSESASPSKSPSKSPSASPSVSPSPVGYYEIDYTLHERIRIGRKHLAFVLIEFGGSSNQEYATGGIPLLTNKLGMTDKVDALVVLESNGDTKLYEWDRSANTIRIFSEARVELTGESTALAATALELLVIGW